MANTVGSSLNKVLVARIATKGELKVCDDMIPCRYNGNQGEDMSDAGIAARGPDYRWNGKKKSAEKDGYDTIASWPVYIKHGGECVIPNTPENLKTLASFEERDEYILDYTPSGHTWTKTGKKLPPLYVRLDVPADSNSPELTQMSDAELGLTAQSILAELQKRGVAVGASAPAPAVAVADPAGMTKEELEAEASRLQAIVTSNAPKHEKQAARQRLDMISTQLQNLV